MLHLVTFAFQNGHSHGHHDHGAEGCCGKHDSGDKDHVHGGEGCCGGHGHDHEEVREEGTGLDCFVEKVKAEFPEFLALFEGVWLLESEKGHQDVYQTLKSTITSHDALWVIPLPKESAGFLKPEGLEWIKPRLYNKK